MLKIYANKLGTLAVLKMEGRMVRGETEILRGAFQSLPEADEVILDLSGVTTVDAGGLGVMLELREQAQSKGVSLTVVNPTKPVRVLLEITRLDSVFQISSGAQSLPAVSHRHRVSESHLASCA